MEHDWLAGAIGNSPNLNKDIATKMGWILISHPMGKPNELSIFFGDKEPTQKQLDTLFDWRQKYEGEVYPGEWESNLS